jgi:hypothetical protein
MTIQSGFRSPSDLVDAPYTALHKKSTEISHCDKDPATVAKNRLNELATGRTYR